jgi:hypothetical protein
VWFTYLRETTDPARATLARHAAPDRRPARKSRDSAAAAVRRGKISPRPRRGLKGCFVQKEPKVPIVLAEGPNVPTEIFATGSDAPEDDTMSPSDRGSELRLRIGA